MTSASTSSGREEQAAPGSPAEDFRGVIGSDFRDSTPWWPPVENDARGKPDIVVVVLDDVGFAGLGCYGAEIDTPVIDALAERGLRFNDFNVTPLCSPTRPACSPAATTTASAWPTSPMWIPASPDTAAG